MQDGGGCPHTSAARNLPGASLPAQTLTTCQLDPDSPPCPDPESLLAVTPGAQPGAGGQGRGGTGQCVLGVRLASEEGPHRTQLWQVRDVLRPQPQPVGQLQV